MNATYYNIPNAFDFNQYTDNVNDVNDHLKVHLTRNKLENLELAN